MITSSEALRLIGIKADLALGQAGHYLSFYANQLLLTATDITHGLGPAHLTPPQQQGGEVDYLRQLEDWLAQVFGLPPDKSVDLPASAAMVVGVGLAAIGAKFLWDRAHRIRFPRPKPGEDRIVTLPVINTYAARHDELIKNHFIHVTGNVYTNGDKIARIKPIGRGNHTIVYSK